MGRFCYRAFFNGWYFNLSAAPKDESGPTDFSPPRIHLRFGFPRRSYQTPAENKADESISGHFARSVALIGRGLSQS